MGEVVMTDQRRMTKAQAILLAATLLLFILSYVGSSASLPWAFLIAAALLAPTAAAFVLPWFIKLEDRPFPFSNNLVRGILFSCYFSCLAIFPLLHALAILHVPQRFGFNDVAAILFGLLLWGLVLFPCILLLKHRLAEVPSDEELKQAHDRIATGWGLTPEEALKHARTFILLGIVAGIGSIGAGWVVIFFGAGVSEQPGRFVYLGFALLVLLGSVPGCVWCVFKGLKFWRVGQVWREQATGTIALRGMYTDSWIEEGTEDKTLVKIKLQDGTTKVLLVGPAFEDHLPEVGEEVEIEYQLGSEAVVGIKAL